MPYALAHVVIDVARPQETPAVSANPVVKLGQYHPAGTHVGDEAVDSVRSGNPATDSDRIAIPRPDVGHTWGSAARPWGRAATLRAS